VAPKVVVAVAVAVARAGVAEAAAAAMPAARQPCAILGAGQ